MSAHRSSGQSIVVLGGGIGGVATANQLRRRLPSQHRVILVNRDPSFSLAASYLWVMSGHRTESQISRPLRKLARRGIDVVIGEIEHIDPDNRSAVVDGRTINGDQMVVSLGATLTTVGVPGLAEHGQTFATLPGAARLAGSLRSLREGRVLIVTATPIYKCPAAPYETAFLIDSLARKHDARSRIDIALHAAEPAPMGVAGQQVSQGVKGILNERGIAYQPSHQISSAEAGIATFADGDTQAFDLLIYMPGIAAPDVIATTALRDSSGWISVDRHTLATDIDGVYAIGDNAQIPLTMGKPLPRAGVFAHGQGIVVADNISRTVAGQPPTARFDGHGGCFIETGDGKAGYGSGDFYADPKPAVTMKMPARRWHLGKVLLEQNILRRWF